MSAKHHTDLVLCRKRPGIHIGLVCRRCEGRCPICDSFVHPVEKVHICDECSFGALEGKCIVCGALGESDAYYCRECCMQGKDRDGCPRILNVGGSRTDNYFHTRYQFQTR
jgi:PHD finger-like domain-containing protein 5A